MSRPTAAQQRLWGKVVALGCMACHKEGVFSFPEIHHVKDYGKNDNSRVYGLCSAHHRPTAAIKGVFNRHGNPIEFAEKYGTDKDLFEYCMKMI
jgi:hypothetical protein